MFRYDVINRFIKERFNNNCSYLEIGVKNFSCYNKIISNNKMSVDPALNCPATYNMTSDYFFSSLESNELNLNKNYEWDIIFIDGLHIADQVNRDIKNAINHTTSNGVIILHDCSPDFWQQAHSDWENFSGSWNGSVWKSLYYSRTTLNYLIYTINTDCGIGIIDKKHKGSKIEHTNIFFDFGVMKLDRERQLGLISIQEFLQYSLM